MSTVSSFADRLARFQQQAQTHYGSSYEGHRVFLRHASYPVLFSPELLYQLWFNFRLYPDPDNALLTREIPEMVVSDLLLSGLCKEVGTNLFEIEADLRQTLQTELRQDPRFGKIRIHTLASFLRQYAKLAYQDDQHERLRELHEQVATATLSPRKAARQLAEKLKAAIEGQQNREQLRISMLAEWFAGENEAFDQLLGVTRFIRNSLSGESEDLLSLPGLTLAQEGEEGQFIRLPVPAHLQGKIEQSANESTQLNVLAQARIESVRKGKTNSLDLSGLGLTSIPPSVGQLQQLRRLDLSNNALTSLDSLTGLSQLETLAIHGNQISDLQPLAQLPRLRVLFAQENPISDLSPLSGLPQLRGLNLSQAQVSDVQPLAALAQLHSLNLNDNQIEELSPLVELEQLTHLHLERNQLTEVEPLLNLKSLIVLNLQGNDGLPLPSPMPADPFQLLENILLLQEPPPIQQSSNVEPEPNVPDFEIATPSLTRQSVLKGSGQRIFALLVGIDRYPAPIPALNGCLNDVQAIERWVQRKAEFKNFGGAISVLENEHATRANLIQAFREQLGQAQEGDQVLFYFAGNGSQERTPEALWYLESDRMNETLVCFDSREEGQKDLADKELATLLDEIAQRGAELTVILDAGSAGSSTRSLSATSGYNERNCQADERQHPMEAYVFPPIRNKAGTVEIPNPPQVAFSAAQPAQAVKEITINGQPRGIFSYTLEQIGQQEIGPLSNQDLLNQLSFRMRQRTYDQAPVLNTTYDFQLEQAFLGGLTSFTTFFFELQFNQKEGWWIDGGRLSGIVGPNPATGARSLLQVFPPELEESQMDDPAFSLGEIDVEAIDEHKSWVQIVGKMPLDQKSVYRARILSLPIPLISVGVEERLLDELEENFVKNREASLYLQLGAIAQTDLVVQQEASAFVVYRAADLGSRAVFQVPASAEAGELLVESLVHYAKFQATLGLRNPNTRIAKEAIQLELLPTEEGADLPLIPEAGGYGVSIPPGEKGPQFRVKLRNTSQERLYVALLYASSEFEINASLLRSGGSWLSAGEEVFAINGQSIRIGFSEALAGQGIRELQETFLLVVSKDEFNASVLKLPTLGTEQAATRSISSFTNTTQLLFDTENPFDLQQDWTTSRLSIQLRLTDSENT